MAAPFVVVRGPALAGKTVISRRLAERVSRKSALISQSDLWDRWIVRHDDDLAAETELVYRQMRLLAAAYLRSGYAVVVDAAFAVCREGNAVTHESDLRELLALVSGMPETWPLLVRLTAPLETLLQRAREAGREDLIDVEALYRAYDRRSLPAALTLDTSLTEPDEAVEAVLQRLGARP